ncbi:MAG: tryptophan synthase subunit alpha [Clostridiales bacterium]|nr:tryptophan synthase subunit alpha [Clostridiales bacterium]
MSKIQDAFAHGKAFIPFITCGDPSLETTEQLVYAMEQAGADLIELGIPFSDPTAEGPVIQEANDRALSGGVTTDKIFDMVKKIRANTQIPMVFMTYANVVFSYGIERFTKTAAEIGMDGIILPDVPFEEKEEFAGACRKNGLALISLIAPTSAAPLRLANYDGSGRQADAADTAGAVSNHARITEIAAAAEGFIYCVSSLGVTGVRSEITTDIGEMVRLVRSASDIPCAIGFGISTPEQAAKMAKNADGVIVGSAIVKICKEYGADCVPKVAEYVKSMKDAIRDL